MQDSGYPEARASFKPVNRTLPSISAFALPLFFGLLPLFSTMSSAMQGGYELLLPVKVLGITFGLFLAVAFPLYRQFTFAPSAFQGKHLFMGPALFVLRIISLVLWLIMAWLLSNTSNHLSIAAINQDRAILTDAITQCTRAKISAIEQNEPFECDTALDGWQPRQDCTVNVAEASPKACRITVKCGMFTRLEFDWEHEP